MTLLELAERVEKLTGPCRETDAEIAKAVGAEHGPRSYVHLESRSYSEHPEIAKRYTKSIDAAMTLVPYQREWHVGSVTLLGTFFAEIVTPSERHIAKECKSAAIALTAAALRARHGEG